MKAATIFTWGYYGWGNHTPQLVEAVDAVETSRGCKPPIFVDIRIRRTVRAQGFQGNHFEKLLGPKRHRWMKRLGNKFILSRKGPNFQIADPSATNDLLDLALESAATQAEASVLLQLPMAQVRRRACLPPDHGGGPGVESSEEAWRGGQNHRMAGWRAEAHRPGRVA